MDILYYMVKRFILLYRITLAHWLMIMAGFLALWTVLMLLLGRSVPKVQSENPALMQQSIVRNRVAFVLNLILMMIGLAIIILVIFVRRKSSEHRMILIPLRVLFGLRAPSDYWHVTVMNIALCVPFACGLCFVIGNKYTHPVCSTVLICSFLSFIAEAMQYILGSGLAEVDDILMNTFGAFLGTLPYITISKMTHRSLFGIPIFLIDIDE